MPSFDRFTDQHTVLLTTYRRDGRPVGTPVSIAIEDGHAYVRTYRESWKAKRLKRNAKVDVAPSTMTGKPTGPAMRATARLPSGSEAERASDALEEKYRILHGILVPLGHRIRGLHTQHYELRAE